MNSGFTFIETRTFSKRIAGLISDDKLAEFQTDLAQAPEKGPPIQGTGGLRKVRWGIKGRGKSGGARIMYLYLKVHGIIHLVFVFAKGESDNLTADEKKQLKKIVEAIKREYRK
jgi:hypothetical protein